MGSKQSVGNNNTTMQSITENLSKDLSTLKRWFNQIIQLPKDTQSFKAQYGDFKDTQSLLSFVTAVANAEEIIQHFGTPAILRQKISNDPDLLMGSTSPQLIYGHMVWLFMQIQHASGTLSHTLGSLQESLEPSNTDQKTRAEQLKAMLNGPSGAGSVATSIANKSETLISQISPLESQLSRVIQTFNQTTLINQANERIGFSENKISSQKKQAAEAYKQWKGVSIPESAWSSPIESGNDESSAGWTMPWDKGKKVARKQYEQLRQTIDESQADVDQKKRITHDLQDFFIDGNQVVTALLGINNSLRKTGKIFGDTSERLSEVCTLSREEQLSNYLWVARSLNLSEAVSDWKAMEETAKGFVQNSLVS